MNFHLEKNVTFFTEQPVSELLQQLLHTEPHSGQNITPQILLKQPSFDFSMFDILLCTAVIRCQGSRK